MAARLQTVRIRAGLYYSLDGQWRIQRQSTMFIRQRVWVVSRLQDGVWVKYSGHLTLAQARAAIVERQEGGWWS